MGWPLHKNAILRHNTVHSGVARRTSGEAHPTVYLQKPSTPQSVGTLLSEWQGFESAFAAAQPPEPTTPTIFDAVRGAQVEIPTKNGDLLIGNPEEVRLIVPASQPEPFRIALSPPMEIDEEPVNEQCAEEPSESDCTPSPTPDAISRFADKSPTAMISSSDHGYDSPAPSTVVTTTRSGRKVTMRVKLEPSPEPRDTRSSGRRGGAIRSTGSAASRTRREALRANASPLPIQAGGVLPVDHRPARGRGRQQQLKRMTLEQREAEAAARLEKNRVAARECRVRRKEHLAILEEQVADYEARDREQRKLIAKLNTEISNLKAKVALSART